MIEETLIRAVCAAVAAMGFGAVSNPSRRSFPVIAVLAASGYALRYVLMQGGGLDIATATLLASMLIGFGSLWLGKMIHSPMTTVCLQGGFFDNPVHAEPGRTDLGIGLPE